MKGLVKIIGTVAIAAAFMYCLTEVGFWGSCLALIPVLMGITKIWDIEV